MVLELVIDLMGRGFIEVLHNNLQLINISEYVSVIIAVEVFEVAGHSQNHLIVFKVTKWILTLHREVARFKLG